MNNLNELCNSSKSYYYLKHYGIGINQINIYLKADVKAYSTFN
jgi:hypothetical protein